METSTAIKVITRKSTVDDMFGCEDLWPSEEIVFYNFADIKKLERFPRCPQEKDLQKRYTHIAKDRDDSVYIFVSHHWLRSYDGSNGWDGRPHPDSSDHKKMNLIIDACEKIQKEYFPCASNLYLWLDYGCIDQDDPACRGRTTLHDVIQCCDMMLTPVYDRNVGDWYDVSIANGGVKNWFHDYNSPGWRHGIHAYLNRGWCRLEMMCNAKLPLLESSSGRLSKLHPLFHRRRPHVLYGSNEQMRKIDPVVLPAIDNEWFIAHLPEDGYVSHEADRTYINRLSSILGSVMEIDENSICALSDCFINSLCMSGMLHGSFKWYELLDTLYEVTGTGRLLEDIDMKVGYHGDYNENGEFHGRGKYVHSDGSIYEGFFFEGKMSGEGFFKFANGSTYNGALKNDLKHGYGTFRAADGSVYIGDWRDDERHGKGKYTFYTGDVYEGDFMNDIIEGMGTFQFANGDTYFGELKNGKADGSGYAKYSNGDWYQGDWHTDERHGIGTYSYINGDVYEGDFKYNKISGSGRLKVSGGGTYEGMFSDGNFDGRGKFTHINGDVYDGDWRCGQKSGKCKLIYSDGTVYKGVWRDNEKNGYGCIQFAEGGMYEGEFKNGNIHGKGTYTYANGAIYRGDFKSGKRNGSGVHVYSDGVVKHSGNFKNGKPSGKPYIKFTSLCIVHCIRYSRSWWNKLTCCAGHDTASLSNSGNLDRADVGLNKSRKEGTRKRNRNKPHKDTSRLQRKTGPSDERKRDGTSTKRISSEHLKCQSRKVSRNGNRKRKPTK